MWRVCAATLTTIFKTPVTEWPLFIFHILLSPNAPHFQNALSLNDPLFLEIFIGENGRHALTEWRPFPPINDHLVICTQYLFGRRDSCSCLIEFRTKIESLTKWPPFFFKLKFSLKDPFFFIVLTKWPPIFLLSSLKDHRFSLFSLLLKDPYFGGLVRTSKSLPYVSATPGFSRQVITKKYILSEGFYHDISPLKDHLQGASLTPTKGLCPLYPRFCFDPHNWTSS